MQKTRSFFFVPLCKVSCVRGVCVVCVCARVYACMYEFMYECVCVCIDLRSKMSIWVRSKKKKSVFFVTSLS